MIRRISCAGIFLLLTPLFLVGNPQQPQNTTGFSSSTELVLVPVVVTDAKGAHVRGLGKGAFRLFDNGHQQEISVFEEVNAEGSSIELANTQNGIYSNQLVSGQPATTLTILMLDSVNTGGVDQALSIRAGLDVLRRWQETRGVKQPILLAALTPRGLKIVHEASTDTAVLISALRRLTTSASMAEATAPAMPIDAALPDTGGSMALTRLPNESSGDYQQRAATAQMETEALQQLLRSDQTVVQDVQDQASYTTYWALQGIANAVAGLPGRKSLIWTASSFPFEVRPTSQGSPQWSVKWNGSGGMTAESPDVAELRSAVLRDLNRAQISVYPVLASGVLINPEFSVTWENTPFNRLRMNAAQATARASFTQPTLGARLLASETAGRPCISTNDIAGCIDHDVDDASHYYLLAFRPQNKPTEHSWHKLKVEVAAEHVSVRGRESYFYGSDPELKRSAKEATDFAIRSNLEFLGLPIVVKWIDVRPGQGKSSIARFNLGVDGRALTIDAANQYRVDLNLAIQAAPDTTPAIQTINTTLKPELVQSIRDSRLTKTGEVELPPGEYKVRFVVRDNASGRIGSVVAPLRIP